MASLWCWMEKHAKPGIGRIARKQDHFNLRGIGRGIGVEGEQFAHQREGDARFQHVIFVRALVLGKGLGAFGLEQGVAVLKVKQGARGDGDGQGGGVFVHVRCVWG